ncbi:hypothetical protein ASF70_08255 [Rhizobium sp. Leaf321]|uniref:Imm52 family immunity protein n=1 Tax=Rhizobium sp. Leaf321 TaxID=1736335 RepID=UPI000715DD1B|nr:Imm52 family immunity protein [Rhizobium sp. Leaf321]KQQ73783.1 hypothetical protein ASF70_08255 [Rhizobium sp. Leaf321]
MIEVNIQLHWGPRAEELDALVQKSVEYLAVVTGLGPSFDTWVQPGKSRKSTLASPVIDPTDSEEIRKLLLKGRNWTDLAPKTVIPELGYHFRLWNRTAGNVDSTLSIRCGAYSEFLSRDAQNLLNFSGRVTAGGKLLLNDGAIEQAFLGSVAIWAPQGGRAWTRRGDAEYTIAAI